ncbi:unnamed protein product [Jaminaea pallidilutea]
MARGRGFEFFCCAIPLINVGSYVIVVEIALVSFITAILALAPHPITAGQGVIPSFGKIIVAVLCFLCFLWQFVGIVAIRRETPKLYHTYVRITTLFTLATLAVAIAFAVVATVRHSDAQTTCIANFGGLPATSASGYTNSSIQQNFGRQICNYFLWAQSGVMFALIVLYGLIQLYMCFALRAYGRAQRSAYRDHKEGMHVMDDEIPLSSRGGLTSSGSSNALLGSHARSAENGTAGAAGAGGYESYRDGAPDGHAETASKRMALHDEEQQQQQFNNTGQHQADTWNTGGGNTTGYPAYNAPHGGGSGGAGYAGTGAGGYDSYPAYSGAGSGRDGYR